MRAPRTLRARASRRHKPAVEPEQEKPEGYRHAQTDGWASAERAPERRYEYGEREWLSTPIVFGFRPNEERA